MTASPRLHPLLRATMCGLLLLAPVPAFSAEPPITLTEFEGTSYGGWVAEGTAFGNAPAQGTLPGQMPVSGFIGHGLANSFHGGDRATGTLTSPEFKIERTYLNFLIGGGGWAGQTCLNLLVDGQTVRTATGPNLQPGGSEALESAGWEVRDLLGRTARLQIVDSATGGWGHINVDQIVLTEDKAVTLMAKASRELVAEQRWLNFPVQNGAPKRRVTVSVDSQVERSFEIELAPGSPDWWAPLEIATWQGKALHVEVAKLPSDSQGLASIDQTAELKNGDNLYEEPQRPQIHFSSRRGWLNDPNGLAFYEGRYHLFYQHNPYGIAWGNMHWGHAVSRDLVHWEEWGEALYPDDSGAMFSGSAVVDWGNTSGLGQNDRPPLVLIYTAAGHPDTQRLAFSNDGGRTFTKYAGNPVLAEITPGNRDPRVFWHAPTKRWVMALYVGYPTDEKATEGKKKPLHTIQFYASPNLREWRFQSQIEGFYECPDLFPLALDGDAAKTKWVLTGASSDYMVGSFDGVTFVPETALLKGHRGRGFYAAQTFNDLPASDGRRLQIGWLQAPSPGEPFSQCMSLPLELALRTTAEGPRLAWRPAHEVEALRVDSQTTEHFQLAPGTRSDIAEGGAKSKMIKIAFTPGATGALRIMVRGVPIIYDMAKQTLSVAAVSASAPLPAGRQELTIFLDRTVVEVFASGGLTYMPVPILNQADPPGTDPQARKITVEASGGAIEVWSIQNSDLRSIWREHPMLP